MLISHHCRAHLNTYVTDPEMHAEFILLENNTNYDNVNVILVSTYSTDLLWLQENKEYLYKKHLVLDKHLLCISLKNGMMKLWCQSLRR